MNSQESIDRIIKQLTRPFLLIAFLTLASMVFSALSSAAPSKCKEIPTDKGKVSGRLLAKKNSCAFLGIPYAQPPVENLRFALPQTHTPWQESRKAIAYGPECIQRPASDKQSQEKVIQSEDCLYLNIWQPLKDSAKLKPVMVFIHGGGFASGSGSLSLYEGSNLALWGDVIVVTINYRLGVFGFLVHPSLKDTNFGLYDQIAALKWVQNNIAHFGGDPKNVTIFGESAGGISVGILLLSPLAKGLFHKAIIESGPINILVEDRKAAEKKGLALSKKVGCTNRVEALACLRGIEAQRLFKAGASGDLLSLLTKKGKTEELNGFSPNATIDKKLIPDAGLKLLQEGKFSKNIPVMIGSNREEISPIAIVLKVKTEEEYEHQVDNILRIALHILHISFDKQRLLSLYSHEEYGRYSRALIQMGTDLGFTCPTLLTAKLLSEQGTLTYLYHSALRSRKGMLKRLGAFHGMELPFIFGNFTLMGFNFAEEDSLKIAQRISSLWTSFARTSIPSARGLPAWPSFNAQSQAYLWIDRTSRVEHFLKPHKCAYFEKVFKKAVK